LKATSGAPGCNVLRTYSQLKSDDVDLTHSARGKGLFIIGEQVKPSTVSVKYITHFSSVGTEEK